LNTPRFGFSLHKEAISRWKKRFTAKCPFLSFPSSVIRYFPLNINLDLISNNKLNSFQDANANRLEKLKVGVQLDLLKMNDENLRERILEATKPEYKRSMQKLHDLVYDEPISSLEKAMFWIEYVIRHKGAKHLEFKAKNVPIHQTFCLDFIAIFLVLSISTTYVSWKILVKLFKSFSLRNKSKIE
jgi:hypothetical protein